ASTSTIRMETRLRSTATSRPRNTANRYPIPTRATAASRTSSKARRPSAPARSRLDLRPEYREYLAGVRDPGFEEHRLVRPAAAERVHRAGEADPAPPRARRERPAHGRAHVEAAPGLGRA